MPLFPLGTVLFPGLLLPLHIFEERYRRLVHELIELPEGTPRRFGVVAIREGRETGADSVRALHKVGCTAELRRVQPYDDGRFDIVTSGVTRFVLREVDASLPYLTGDVELLRETAGEPDDLTTVVADLFGEYLEVLGTTRGVEIESPELPDDALLLSYLIAATMLLDLADKQELLEAEDAAHRLRIEARLLRRELGLLRAVGAVPPPEQLREGTSLN